MKLWSDLRALLFPPAPPPTPADPTPAESETPPPAIPPAPVVADSPDLEGRRQRAAERLLEDERLRGDTTDEEFQPLLDWALAAIDRVVVNGSDQDVDAATGQTRTVVQSIGEALAEAPDLSAEDFATRLEFALEGIQPPLVPAASVEATREALLSEIRTLSHQKDQLSGTSIAERLAAVLGGDAAAGEQEAMS